MKNDLMKVNKSRSWMFQRFVDPKISKMKNNSLKKGIEFYCKVRTQDPENFEIEWKKGIS